MKRVVLTAALGLFALGVILVSRALWLGPAQETPPAGPAVTFDEAALAARLAKAVRFPTLSHRESQPSDLSAMAGLRAYLAETYPRTFSALKAETVGGWSLLFTWPGSDPSRKPVLLLSHMDVVPVSPGTEKDWLHPPFAGEIADGYIWGRGTLDDKSGVLGLLEAVEHLLGEGFAPRRTVYLAFGHDEEVGGRSGAAAVAALLERRGVQADYILDEGGVISVGLVRGLKPAAALIGIAEKGYLSVELAVTGVGGHSSAPPLQTAIGRLARAVAEVEAHPLPRGVRGALREMLLAVAPDMSFANRLVIANLWLFEPLMTHLLSADDSSRALIGTTQAATLFQSGVAENVLPAKARAVINFRLMPGDTVDDVVAHVRGVIGDDQVQVTALPGAVAASPLSSSATLSYKALARAVRATYPGTLVAPYLTIGGTDSVHYERLSPNIYRFLPAHFGPEDVPRFHGTNERLSVRDYADMVRFFLHLVRETAG